MDWNLKDLTQWALATLTAIVGYLGIGVMRDIRYWNRFGMTREQVEALNNKTLIKVEELHDTRVELATTQHAENRGHMERIEKLLEDEKKLNYDFRLKYTNENQQVWMRLARVQALLEKENGRLKKENGDES